MSDEITATKVNEEIARHEENEKAVVERLQQMDSQLKEFQVQRTQTLERLVLIRGALAGLRNLVGEKTEQPEEPESAEATDG